MKYEVLIPQQGLTTETVTITEIFKKPGDKVSKGDELLEMESEKATIALESPEEGIILEFRVKKGEEPQVGDIAVIIEIS